MQNQRKGLVDSGQHRRILLVMLVLGIVSFVPIGFRLWFLMVKDYDYYASNALRNQSRTTFVTADRGNIYDCNMNLLAGSVSAPNLYLNPRELKQAKVDVDEISRDLGEILEKDPEWILKKAKNQGRRYEQIGKSLDEKTGEIVGAYISNHDLRGIHLEPGSRRTYPFGPLAAQVIGFTDASMQGVEGVELAWDRSLKGEKSQVITTKGNNEMDIPFGREHFLPGQEGSSLVLSIDTTVQSILENQLQSAMERYEVKNGAFGLVMNCKTGAVLAMATLPNYDPNTYQEILDPQLGENLQGLKDTYEGLQKDSPQYKIAKEEYLKSLQKARLRQWRNRVISDGYEPGSTFKVMTMAAALDTGAIDLNTDFYCGGAEQIPGRAQRLHCWRHQGHKAQKTAQALQNSCNIAFAHIALKLGGEQFYEYIRRFGILEKTGIDLKGESKGIFFDKALITNTEKWGTASLTSGSFGQTFKLTPIQLVCAISSVVNGGKLLKPYVVSKVLDRDENVLFERKPQVVRQTISQETSETMRSLLRSVVTEGTAKNAAVAGYAVGGKTGTSEKIDVFDENGRRVLDKIVSFVGIAPMDDPNYVVLAALDTPSRDCGTYLSGGAMAAPTVGAILKDLLPYLEVKKEEEEEPPVVLPDCSGLSLQEAEQALEQLGLTAVSAGEEEKVTDQLPGPGQTAKPGSQVILYFGEKPRKLPVPNYYEKTRPEAEKLGFPFKVEGNPQVSPGVKVIFQDPAPGTMVLPGTEVTLKFADITVRP